jgi:acetyl esterase/lipase
MWVGDRERASKFVLFFHGGGYMAPLQAGHLNWCWNAYVDNQEEHEVAVAVLPYDLAPGSKYPTQLRQAAAAMNHLLRTGVEPHDLIFGGDSAGGNLSAQLLYHISHPIQGVEPVQFNGRRVAGVFTVSPWVSGRTDTLSFHENDGIDMLSAAIVKETQVQTLRPEDTRVHGGLANPVLPLDGDWSWFGDIQTVTEALYITCGGQEVFKHHVCTFSEAVRRRNPDLKLTLEVAHNEVHDSILLEGAHELNGDATQRMRRWASSRFSDGRDK